MQIQPDEAKPGLWIDPGWRLGMPGTFAVVMGVSQYDHLDQGTDPAEDTFDLGQLRVSALTAYRFFVWLRDTYVFKDSPLVWCWLLLAPTPEELRLEPQMKKHFARSNFENAKSAILEWYGVMSRQGNTDAKSRGFFFFSGHGIEVHADKQVLLPSDYPPRGVLNDAISTNNLFRGLLCQNVPTQFLFIDACRNDHERLLEKEISGAEILNTGRSRRNRAAIVPLFRATASGFQAWQPSDVRDGPSVFGTALLEGLQTGRAFPADCSNGPCSVPLYDLQKYVNRRVREILRKHNEIVESPVRIGGESSDTVVTESRGDGDEAMRGPVRISPAPGPGDVPEALPIVTTLTPWHPSELAPAPIATTSPQPIRTAHDLFGSERMEELWKSAAVFDVKGAAWRQGSEAFKIHEVERDETRLYRITISVPREGAQVLQVGQPWFEREGLPPRRFAFLLPGRESAGTQGQDVRYRLSIIFEYGTTEAPAPSGLVLSQKRLSRRSVSRLEMDLSPANDGLLGMAARLWDRYREANVGSALTSSDMKTAIAIIRDKLDSPLAATVAALLVLRGRREDLLLTGGGESAEYWLRNLATWFAGLPDGAVLWAENLQRLGAEAPPGESARAWLREVNRRGIPHTAEALGYLATLVEEMGNLDEDVELTALRGRVGQALRSFRSGGLFSVFANVDDMSLFASDERAPAPTPAFA